MLTKTLVIGRLRSRKKPLRLLQFTEMVGNDSRLQSCSASGLKRQISVRVKISKHACIVGELIKERQTELVEQMDQSGGSTGSVRRQFEPLICAECEGTKSFANRATILLHKIGKRFLPFSLPNAWQKYTEIHREFAVKALTDAGNDVVLSDGELAHLEIHDLNDAAIRTPIISPALLSKPGSVAEFVGKGVEKTAA